jgi:1,4-dihydroxy-6-naphthoate synthase
MRIAFSPCPNDTFIFHAWVHGLLPGAPELDVIYADIDITNRLATGSTGPQVLKISCAALPWTWSEYALLPCGGALGRGCGPLVLTANDAVGTKDPSLCALRRIAVPSERSTAYLLFRLWAAQHVPGGVNEILILPFHEIMTAVRDGVVDAGLVIHEARFLYPSYGLTLLADLGKWWESVTHLPVPLGVIIAHRSLDLAAIAHWTRTSVQYAWQHPHASQEYVLHHAKELAPQIVQAHIHLYVNEFTANLGEEGYAAITTLLNRASQAGLVPKVDLMALRSL